MSAKSFSRTRNNDTSTNETTPVTSPEDSPENSPRSGISDFEPASSQTGTRRNRTASTVLLQPETAQKVPQLSYRKSFERARAASIGVEGPSVLYFSVFGRCRGLCAFRLGFRSPSPDLPESIPLPRR